MTDDILKDLLSDILQQQATILKLVLDLKKQQEKVTPESINVTTQTLVVDDDFKLFAHKFFFEFDKGLKQIKSLSDKIPKEVNIKSHEETKIVLFSKKYDEGNYGVKDLLQSLYFFFGIWFALFLLVKYIPSYLGGKDENIPYRNTVHWYYFKTDRKSGEELLKTVNHFKNGDTSYINELNRSYIELEKIKK